jgi:hypothetical protein
MTGKEIVDTFRRQDPFPEDVMTFDEWWTECMKRTSKDFIELHSSVANVVWRAAQEAMRGRCEKIAMNVLTLTTAPAIGRPTYEGGRQSAAGEIAVAIHTLEVT